MSQIRTEEEWKEAKEYFDEVMKQYEDLKGTPGVNTEFALRNVFRPLLARYNVGDRLEDLYQAMIHVE